MSVMLGANTHTRPPTQTCTHTAVGNHHQPRDSSNTWVGFTGAHGGPEGTHQVGHMRGFTWGSIRSCKHMVTRLCWRKPIA